MCLAFLFFPIAVFANGPARIAVIDFQVQSDNPAYKYYGKGFAEFTLIELAKSRDVVVIDREKRNKAVEELAFSLSDLADESTQLKVGSFLTAQYLVTGSIFEMGGKLVVTVALLSVENGSLVFMDKLTGAPGEYDAITASLAARVLSRLSLKTPETVAAKVEKPQVKPEKAAERFSIAVDAIDRGDAAAAKSQLTEARKLDPSSDAIRIFLSKLTVNTAKLKIMRDPYFPDGNPAYLGVIQYDTLSFGGAGAINLAYYGIVEDYYDQGVSYGDYSVIEGEVRYGLKYQLPIGKNFGASAEAAFSILPDTLRNTIIPTTYYVNINNYLGILGFGWAPTDALSLGIGLSLYYQTRYYPPIPYEDPLQSFHGAFSLGLLVKNPSSTVIYDFMAGYALDSVIRIDTTSETYSEVQTPLYIENSITFAFAEKTLFLVIKQLDDIALDRRYFFGRILMAMEWWPANWCSFHVSAEGSLGVLDENTLFGYGGNAGVTFRIPGTGWDLDAGFSYRLRPSRILGTVLVPQYIPTVEISKTASLFTRK